MTTTTPEPAADAGAVPPAEPPGLVRARTVARLLDESIRVPGTSRRVGLDPIAGLLPVAGDTVAAVASLYVVAVAVRAGLPTRAIARMLALVGIDYVVGSVPVLGWVVDAVLKVNTRNLATLEAYLTDAE